jgi:hypothetical protein
MTAIRVRALAAAGAVTATAVRSAIHRVRLDMGDPSREWSASLAQRRAGKRSRMDRVA